MNTTTLKRITGIALLAIITTLVVFVLLYALQYLQLAPMLATVSWNG
jgi:hypothetical protein